MMNVPRVSALLFASLTAAAFAQTPFNSHQVNPDNSITFRYRGPGVKSASVGLDWLATPLPMTQDANGVWSVTTQPLTPEYYGYSFKIDGHDQLDPLNGDVRANYVSGASNVMVPASPSAPWELTAIPHGRVDHIRFTSHIAKNLPAGQDAYQVYTPPSYDPRHKGGYPVLYLLHGWSDNETGWVEVGHAGLILDSLIHDGKAVPMIVVMPQGYGDLDFVLKSHSAWDDQSRVTSNTHLFTDTLLQEILPAVESSYNVAKGRDNRAIIGLSMGGLESLSTGLNNPDKFAWVGGMSSALKGADLNAMAPAIIAPGGTKRASLRLFWVACGTDDALINPNRAFIAWARQNGLDPIAIETPGRHTWEVWRDNLIHFAPLLFQPNSQPNPQPNPQPTP